MDESGQVTIKVECEPWCYDESEFLTEDLSTCEEDIEPTQSKGTASGSTDTVASERNGCWPPVPHEVVYIKQEIEEEAPAELDDRATERPTYTPHPSSQTDNEDYACSRTSVRRLPRVRATRRRRSAKEAYACPTCPARFSRRSALSSHRRLHLLERPHACPTCHKRFLIASELRLHMPVHTGERAHVCDVCAKAFAHTSTLRRHKFTHDGGATKPFRCTTCGRGFVSPSMLRAHHVMHTDERPFACEQCGRTFKLLTSYKTHRRQKCASRADFHCPKLFGCERCDRSFKSRHLLRQHMLVHTGERPHQCDKCGRRFRLSSTLTKHKSTHVWHYYT